MAAPQIGDVIKFAEIAWTLLDYGWSDDLNAKSLQRLEDVINSARSSVLYHGQTAPDDLGWDEDSLIDIIGDYYGTLNECLLLVKANKTYMGTITGPLANIHWNIFVQPQVEKLRRRILLHNTKVQHVLQPFEIDLRMRIHRDLVQRISHVHRGVEAVHQDVRRMDHRLQALMRAFDPSLIQGFDQPQDSELCEIDIPDGIYQQLQTMFENHPDLEMEGVEFPPLRDIADAFVTRLDKSTRLFQPDTLPIDFDISKATLIPRYASPDGRESLELLLKDGRDMHRLVFCSRYRLQVVFVLGSGQKVKELASLQLWQPSRLAGAPPNLTAATVADTGTLHTMPTEPLLVLFTRHPDCSPSSPPQVHQPPAIVAVSIDSKTSANYRACRCTSLPDCPITALERGASGGRAMKVLRVRGEGGVWDVLPLAEALRSQRGGLHVVRGGGGGIWRKGVIRVSVCFERVEGRIEFAGLPCRSARILFD
ncbi:hypothetical protein NEMBOFW57_008272 [Staphylotrichum longicolle]|uniref:Uncharacterized protein n=1 Tax=Staphylotrichum longicolle TaxID=669026 RepID=A0AAD4HWH2_9PEZI|nr:hypothetical protein NEMBOFW57_008272 [Staphylotrichum longicolle]